MSVSVTASDPVSSITLTSPVVHSKTSLETSYFHSALTKTVNSVVIRSFSFLEIDDLSRLSATCRDIKALYDTPLIWMEKCYREKFLSFDPNDKDPKKIFKIEILKKLMRHKLISKDNFLENPSSERPDRNRQEFTMLLIDYMKSGGNPFEIIDCGISKKIIVNLIYDLIYMARTDDFYPSTRKALPKPLQKLENILKKILENPSFNWPKQGGRSLILCSMMDDINVTIVQKTLATGDLHLLDHPLYGPWRENYCINGLLNIACDGGSPRVVKLLLQNKADPHTPRQFPLGGVWPFYFPLLHNDRRSLMSIALESSSVYLDRPPYNIKERLIEMGTPYLEVMSLLLAAAIEEFAKKIFQSRADINVLPRPLLSIIAGYHGVDVFTGKDIEYALYRLSNSWLKPNRRFFDNRHLMMALEHGPLELRHLRFYQLGDTASHATGETLLDRAIKAGNREVVDKIGGPVKEGTIHKKNKLPFFLTNLVKFIFSGSH